MFTHLSSGRASGLPGCTVWFTHQDGHPFRSFPVGNRAAKVRFFPALHTTHSHVCAHMCTQAYTHIHIVLVRVPTEHSPPIRLLRGDGFFLSFFLSLLPSFLLSFFLSSFLSFSLFIFRERGKEEEREGEKHQCVVASRMPPIGDLAQHPGMCPDWESTGDPLVLRLALNPLSHTSQGWRWFLYKGGSGVGVQGYCQPKPQG